MAPTVNCFRLVDSDMLGSLEGGQVLVKTEWLTAEGLALVASARRISVRGMIASDPVKGRVKEFDNEIKAWIKAWIDERKVTPVQAVTEGLEHATEAFPGVFEGKNHDMRLIKLAA